LLGRALLELGNTSEAIQELETALRQQPHSPEVHYSLARAYSKAKRTEQARRERAEFMRLNGILARKPQTSESQSYRSSSDRGSLPPDGLNEPAPQK
jgi:predicted Zn-dependent protease